MSNIYFNPRSVPAGRGFFIHYVQERNYFYRRGNGSHVSHHVLLHAVY